MDLFAEVEENAQNTGATEAAGASTAQKELARQRIAELVHVITERHARRGLGGRAWSLSELGMDDGDHTFLCRALEGLPGAPLRDLLTKNDLAQTDMGLRFDNKPVTARSALGLLILLACAESARRWATDGEIWAAAARPFADARALGTVLFSSQGQPTDVCKQALRDAVTTFGLRHVLPPQTTAADEDASSDNVPTDLDAEKKKWWFHTIKLQYGVSAKVVTSNGLTDLIAYGGGPDAVRWLLYGLPGPDQTTQPATRSESFRRFLADLQQFRREAIDATELRSRLGRSPWLPPVGFKEIEKAARRRRRVGSGDIEPATARLVSDLRLNWDGSASSGPSLRFRLEPDVLNGVLEEAVRVTANGKTIADAFRQTDGQMFPLARGGFGGDAAQGDPFAFQLPFTGDPELTVSLLATGQSGGDEVRHAEAAVLYKPSDEVSAFHINGREAGAGVNLTLTPGRACLLLVGKELELGTASDDASSENSSSPLGAPRWPLGAQGTLYAIAPGWRGPLCAFFPDLPDEPLWVSSDNERVVLKPALPEWAAPCKYGMEVLPGDDNPLIGLRITPPEGVEVVRTRYSGQTALAADAEGLWGAVACASAPPAFEVLVWLSLNGEKAVRVPCVVRTPQEGRAFYRRQDAAGGWAVCPATKTLIVKSLTGGAALRVFAPSDWTCDGNSGNNGLLFEGTRLLGPVPLGLSRQQGAKFAAPSGWGGRLAVRCRRFNDRDTPVVIAKSAADFGLLSSVELIESEENGLHLTFGQRLTPTDDTRVHLWDETGRMTTRDASQIEVIAPREWRVPLWADQRRACIVAVSFKGIRIGARPLNLRRALPRFGTSNGNADSGSAATPLETAAWLRWLRLPLLRDDLLPAVTQWLNGTGGGAPAVYAWLRGVGLPNGFSLETIGEAGWPPVVRRLIKDWTPNGGQAKELLALLYPAPTLPFGAQRVVNQRDVPMRIGRALAELADVSPDLASATLTAYWNECLLPQRRTTKHAGVIEEAARAEWNARFLALIQSENEKKNEKVKPEDRQETPSVSDANVLGALASALGLADTFLDRLLATTPPASWTEHQRDHWQTDRDIAMEASGELRALVFLRRLKQISMPDA